MSQVRLLNGPYHTMEFNLKHPDGVDPYAPPSLTLTTDEGEDSFTYTLTPEKDGDFYVYTTDAPAPVPEKVEEKTDGEVQDEAVSD